MDDLNTFQDQLIEYFSGTTGSALGAGVVTSSLQRTKNESFAVGYQPSMDQRGILLAADVAFTDTVLIDFNSLDNGANDYDTRIISYLGEAGTSGRGTLRFQANSFEFIGNVINPSPIVQMPNGINFIGEASVYHPPTNQGRLHDVRQVVWSGNMASTPVNPAITIQLQDIDTGVPFTGHFTITMSNGFSGTGQSICFTEIAITKDIAGANPWNWERAYDKGDDLANLYVNVDITNPSYPQILLYNKTADPARYLISGFVYYDTEM